MKIGPLVSVVMPTHNRAALLARSIRSVLAQTYRTLEVFVVDDASTDRTREVVQSFDDHRLHYVRLEQNRRAAAARNVGLMRARGEFIAFQDDDDVWFLPKIARQLDALQGARGDAGLNLCGHIRLSPASASYVGGPRAFAALDFRQGPLVGFGLIATPGWLVRRTCLEQAGPFDERLRTWDDWELALRLSKVCRFSHLDEPLLIQDRVQGGQMWRNEAAYSNDMRIVLEKHADLWAAHPRLLAQQYLTIAKSECLHHSAGEARHWLASAISTDPALGRAWAFFVLSLLGRPAASALVRSARLWTRRSGRATG